MKRKIIRIYGCNGDKPLKWALNYIAENFDSLFPVETVYYDSTCLWRIKKAMWETGVQLNLTHALTSFAKKLDMPPDFFRLPLVLRFKRFYMFIQQTNASLMYKTLVWLDGNAISNPMAKFILERVKFETLIIVADPNAPLDPNQMGRKFLNIWKAENNVIYDTYSLYPHPRRIVAVLQKYLTQSRAMGAKPYWPRNWKGSKEEGTVEYIPNENLIAEKCKEWTKDDIPTLIVTDRCRYFEKFFLEHKVPFLDVNQANVGLGSSYVMFYRALHKLTHEPDNTKIDAADVRRLIRLLGPNVLKGQKAKWIKMFKSVPTTTVAIAKLCPPIKMLCDVYTRDGLDGIRPLVRGDLAKRLKYLGDHLLSPEWSDVKIHLVNWITVLYLSFPRVYIWSDRISWSMLTCASHHLILKADNNVWFARNLKKRRPMFRRILTADEVAAQSAK